jgi:hypothetical protein
LDSGSVINVSEDNFNYTQSDFTYLEFNKFLTEGFKRNNLICPNHLNLEFLFNDNDALDFSMNRYFGLFVNKDFKYTYSANSYEGNIVNIDNNYSDTNDFKKSI